MKKLIAVFALFAVLVPLSAFAASTPKFTNMSGANSRVDVFFRRVKVIPSTNYIQQVSVLTHFTGGADHGIMHTIADGVRYFEDHVNFANAQMVVKGDLLRAVPGKKVLDTDYLHRGPASFTLFSPYSSVAKLLSNSATSKIVQLSVSGSAEVSKVRNNKKGVVLMSLQPSTMVFNVYSTGALIRTRRVDGYVKVNPMVKAFRDISTTPLPSGFENVSTTAQSF